MHFQSLRAIPLHPDPNPVGEFAATATKRNGLRKTPRKLESGESLVLGENSFLVAFSCTQVISHVVGRNFFPHRMMFFFPASYIWMFPKNSGVFPPNPPWINRVFHYLNHPFWGISLFLVQHPNIGLAFVHFASLPCGGLFNLLGEDSVFIY